MCLDVLGALSKALDTSIRPSHEVEALLSRYNAMCSLIGLSPLSFDLYEVKKRLDMHLEKASFIGKHLENAETLGDHLETRGDALDVAIYLENLRSGHNIGNILRTAEAMQIGSVYLSPKMCSKEHPSVKKAAMGAEQWVSVIENAHLEDLPRPLIAIELTQNAESIEAFSFPKGPFSIAFGNEVCGLSQKALDAADAVVQIPLYGKKASLNVSNAFAIVAHKIREQASRSYNRADQNAAHLG